jgi:cyclophilin family peptidyl-prolyl cis-trans isomerase
VKIIFNLVLGFGLFFTSLIVRASDITIVVVETNRGRFELELFPEKAPLSVQNFLSYVDTGYYDGTIFHRVVKNFVVQAGGLNPDMSERPEREPIKNEADNGLSNVKGSVALARTEEVDSATSHFFINLKDNLKLDYTGPEHFGYAVFGRVIVGYEVIESIEKEIVQTVGDYDDVPVTPIVIERMYRK